MISIHVHYRYPLADDAYRDGDCVVSCGMRPLDKDDIDCIRRTVADRVATANGPRLDPADIVICNLVTLWEDKEE